MFHAPSQNQKTKRFYIQSGKVLLETDFNGATASRIMTAGDTAHIVPGMWHRITAVADAEVIEFSTFHMEEDSYRRTTSGKADLKAMGISE